MATGLYRFYLQLIADFWGRILVRSPTHIARTFETVKKQITRISNLQSSKIATALYVLMGLIYTLIGIPMLTFVSEKLKSIGIIYVLMPIGMAVLGFIFFVIFAAFYNLLARWLGSIEVEVTDIRG
jgi:hypothetical protein